MKRLALLVVLSVVVSGCAASRAFRKGQDAANVGNWDAAVSFYTTAVQANPDNAEYKLQPATRPGGVGAAASRQGARSREAGPARCGAVGIPQVARAGERPTASSEPRLPSSSAPSANGSKRRAADRASISSVRRTAASTRRRCSTRASREPLRLNFSTSSLRDILNFIGTPPASTSPTTSSSPTSPIRSISKG